MSAKTKGGEFMTDGTAVKKLETQTRFLIASSNQEHRDLISKSLTQFLAGAEFSYANDGSEAIFKLFWAADSRHWHERNAKRFPGCYPSKKAGWVVP